MTRIARRLAAHGRAGGTTRPDPGQALADAILASPRVNAEAWRDTLRNRARLQGDPAGDRIAGDDYQRSAET